LAEPEVPHYPTIQPKILEQNYLILQSRHSVKGQNSLYLPLLNIHMLCKSHKALIVAWVILCCEYYCMNMGKYYSCTMDLLHFSMADNISVEIYFETTKTKASVTSILSTSEKKDVKHKCYAKQIKHDSARKVFHSEGMMVQNLKVGLEHFLHISSFSLPSFNYLPVPRHGVQF
jgi:hypothetical protein